MNVLLSNYILKATKYNIIEIYLLMLQNFLYTTPRIKRRVQISKTQSSASSCDSPRSSVPARSWLTVAHAKCPRHPRNETDPTVPYLILSRTLLSRLFYSLSRRIKFNETIQTTVAVFSERYQVHPPVCRIDTKGKGGWERWKGLHLRAEKETEARHPAMKRRVRGDR